MKERVVTTSLEEDFKSFGMAAMDPNTQARMAGLLSESREIVSSILPATSGDQDPMDGPVVSEALFTSILALPFDRMTAEDCDEVLEALKQKTIPEGNAALEAMAEQTVKKILAEKTAKLMRVFKKRGMAKKRVLKCPRGYRKVSGTRRCERVSKGEASKLRRKGRIYRRSGAGKKAEKISKRMQARREDVSPFALELNGLLEDTTSATQTVRDEIVDRLGRIFDLLGEEFNDNAVYDVLLNAYKPIVASADAGRLDEDVMEDEAFMAEIKPAVALITKSIARLEATDRGALGNA